MTPEDLDPQHVDEPLSPEDEETVRRLLVAAGGKVTLPEDVATHLDEVLAGLQAERDGTASTHVTDLTARRRRRWPTVLVAAAAVAVVGVGVGNVMDNTSGGGDAASESTDAGASTQGEGGAELGATDDEDARLPQAPPKEGGPFLTGEATSTLPRMRTDSATLDAQRIHDLSLRSALAEPQQREGSSQAPACEVPAPAPGETLVAVSLDGKRATLLFRAKEGGKREAQVYSCDDSDSPVLVTRVQAR